MSRARPQSIAPPDAAAARGIWWLGLGLVAAALAAYHNSFSVPFQFDDREAILDNASIRQLGEWRQVLLPPSNGTGVTGRPLVNLALAVDQAIGSGSAVAFHVTNFLCHAGAGLVLFGLLRRTLVRPMWHARVRRDAAWLAALAALLWLVHPLQTESVTFIIQRTEVLVSLFYLLALYGLARSAEPGAARGWVWLAVAAGALGMASKEVMVTMPVVALLYDRTFLAGTFREAWRQRARVHLGLMATWLVLAALLWHMGGSRGTAAGFGLGATWWNYALKQCEAIVHYLRLVGWPHPLVVDYGAVVIGDPRLVWPQALLLVVLVAGTVAALRWRPVWGFAGAMFFIVLSPSSSVVPLVAQTMAEHRMYLPLAPVVAAVVLGCHAWWGRRLWVAGLALAAGWGALTERRNVVYQDEISLWRDTAARQPDNPRAHLWLAASLKRAGRVNEAVAEYQATLRLNPWEPNANANYADILVHSNLSDLLRQLGRRDEAIAHGETAVKLKPELAEAHCNLGIALADAGRLDEALPHYREALRLKPNYPTAGNNLAVALMNQGRLDAALAQIDATLRLSPGDARSRNTRGVILANLGRRDEAGREFERAVALDPADAVARENLRKLRAEEAAAPAPKP
jgi:Flp pilus assembly protein TadD